MIKIRKTQFKGNNYVDIRKFYVDKTTKEEHPTRKGITFPMTELSETIDALEKIEAENAQSK
jgi:hypothetical protein